MEIVFIHAEGGEGTEALGPEELNQQNIEALLNESNLVISAIWWRWSTVRYLGILARELILLE